MVSNISSESNLCGFDVVAYGGTGQFVFVSYAHADSERVFPVIEYLERRGYNIWFDEGITPGSNWRLALQNRIKQSSVVMAFVSRRFLESAECAAEVETALGFGKKIISVFLDPIQCDSEWARKLYSFQGIEKYALENDSRFYIKLLSSDVLEECRDTEDYQVHDECLVRYNGRSANVIVPEFITKIGYSAFEGCSHVKSVYIPHKVDRIGKFAFSNMGNLHSIQTSSGNRFFSSREGVLFNKSGVYLLRYPGAKAKRHYSIPEGVRFIALGAFAEASILDSVFIPSTVQQIGDRAFEACRNIIDVEIKGSIKKIRPYTFSRCASLVGCGLPEGLTLISDGAFSGCSSLATAPIPSSVTAIGEMAFAHCEALENVILPPGVDLIPEYCFHECSSLTRIDLSGVKIIEQYAFKNCESLCDVVFGDGLSLIGRAAFSGCLSMESLRIPGSVLSIGEYAFDRCGSLRRVEIGEGVRQIRHGAFAEDWMLTEVTIPKSVLDIEDGAFPDGVELVPA